MTPAQAAEGVPFDPTLSIGVSASSQLGEEVPINVHIEAVSGDEWTDTGTSKAPITVRIDAYGEYEDGAVPAESATVPDGTVAADSEVFVVDKGPGDYTFTLTDFDYKEGSYVFVASVLTADGTNSSYITSEASTAFAVPTSTTEVSFSPMVVGAAADTTLTVGDKTSSTLTGTGFNGTALDVTSTLYGPFATAPTESDTVPSDAPIVGTTLNTFSGGSTQTGEETLSAPGFYVWHSTIAAGPGSPAFTPAFATAGTVIDVKAAVVAPRPAPVVTPTPTQPVAPEPTVPDEPVADPTPVDDGVTPDAVSYATCDDAYRAEEWFLIEGIDEGYSEALDEDKDGIACEDITRFIELNEDKWTAEFWNGENTLFDDCKTAEFYGYQDIKRGEFGYSNNLDGDKDGIGCETDGSETAVAIDGGFAPASSVDNSPFIAGGVGLLALTIGLGASLLIFRRK